LILRQNVDPEALLGMQMRMGPRTVVDANQEQRGIERHGSKGVGGHAMDCALKVESDDGHSRGKAPHRFPEFGWTEAHSASGSQAATAYISTAVARRGQRV
jgi:hypothetical protein